MGKNPAEHSYLFTFILLTDRLDIFINNVQASQIKLRDRVPARYRAPKTS